MNRDQGKTLIEVAADHQHDGLKIYRDLEQTWFRWHRAVECEKLQQRPIASSRLFRLIEDGDDYIPKVDHRSVRNTEKLVKFYEFCRLLF